MLWVVQAAARYFVFFSNQRNRPPTQLSCLKGCCMPLGDFGEGLIGVGWARWTPPSGCLLWLKYSVIGSIGEVCSPTYSISTLQCHEAVCPCLALMEDAEPFGCFHVNTFLMASAPLINISISTPCSSHPYQHQHQHSLQQPPINIWYCYTTKPFDSTKPPPK